MLQRAGILETANPEREAQGRISCSIGLRVVRVSAVPVATVPRDGPNTYHLLIYFL